MSQRPKRAKILTEAPIPEELPSDTEAEVTAQASERTRWAWALGTLAGVGFWRPAPGTWASAITIGLWWPIANYLVPPTLQWIVAIVLVWLLIIFGIPAAGIVERESGVVDPSQVVIDEVAGQMLALVAVPLRWKFLLLSFILFRAFDIVKPPPLRRLERLGGGGGIVLDDVGAGAYSLIVVQVLVHWHVLG